MSKILILLCTFIALAISAQSAIINSFKLAGVVKSFDSQQVRVLCQGREVDIPKSTIFSGLIRPGEAVSFQLTGQQMEQIIFKKSPDSKAKTQ